MCIIPRAVHGRSCVGGWIIKLGMGVQGQYSRPQADSARVGVEGGDCGQGGSNPIAKHRGKNAKNCGIAENCGMADLNPSPPMLGCPGEGITAPLSTPGHLLSNGARGRVWRHLVAAQRALPQCLRCCRPLLPSPLHRCLCPLLTPVYNPHAHAAVTPPPICPRSGKIPN